MVLWLGGEGLGKGEGLGEREGLGGGERDWSDSEGEGGRGAVEVNVESASMTESDEMAAFEKVFLYTGVPSVN